MNEVDLILLLKKYIQHVKQCEGVSFVDRLNDHTASDVKFTKDEIVILEKLDTE